MMKTKENDMTDFNSALEFIHFSADQDQLQTIMEAVKRRREKLAMLAKHTLRVGQDVKFTSKGMQYAGRVMSIRVKKATVEITSPMRGIYVVPLSMLQAA